MRDRGIGILVRLITWKNWFESNSRNMDKRDKIALVASLTVIVLLTGNTLATVINVDIDLNQKEMEKLDMKKNITGNTYQEIIEYDVKNLYNTEYDEEAVNNFTAVAEKCVKECDYKQLIEATKYLKSIMGTKE